MVQDLLYQNQIGKLSTTFSFAGFFDMLLCVLVRFYSCMRGAIFASIRSFFGIFWSLYDLEQSKKKAQKSGLNLARAVGLEPTTYGLTVPAIQRGVKFQFCRRFLRVLAN